MTNPVTGLMIGLSVEPNVVLTALWGSASDDVWAVGTYGTFLHWDGAAWESVTTGYPLTLWGVWGSASNDVWAVGSEAAIVHWDGTSWVSVPNPLTGTTSGNNLYDVWGTGPNDVWAVGDGGIILRWDGSSWNNVVSGCGDYLYGVWGTGPSNVWATGTIGTILHWDGSGWSNVASPLTGSRAVLQGVWGTSADDVWAFGLSAVDLATGYFGDMMHWDGSAWSITPNPMSVYWYGVRGMWGSPTDVWAVGNFGIMRSQL